MSLLQMSLADSFDTGNNYLIMWATEWLADLT